MWLDSGTADPEPSVDTQPTLQWPQVEEQPSTKDGGRCELPLVMVEEAFKKLNANQFAHVLYVMSDDAEPVRPVSTGFAKMQHWLLNDFAGEKVHNIVDVTRAQGITLEAVSTVVDIAQTACKDFAKARSEFEKYEASFDEATASVFDATTKLNNYADIVSDPAEAAKKNSR